MLLLLKLSRIGLRQLDDKIRLPLTKKIYTVAGGSMMRFFIEMAVVVALVAVVVLG